MACQHSFKGESCIAHCIISLGLVLNMHVACWCDYDRLKHELCCIVMNRLTVTDSDGAQNYTFADATVIKG